jgi:hypothetical protein
MGVGLPDHPLEITDEPFTARVDQEPAVSLRVAEQRIDGIDPVAYERVRGLVVWFAAMRRNANKLLTRDLETAGNI